MKQKGRDLRVAKLRQNCRYWITIFNYMSLWTCNLVCV